MNPKRLKGFAAFATSYGIYSYLPYLAVYTGPTIPVVGASLAVLFGMFSFAESQTINSIEVIKDAGENQGKLLINIAQSPFVSSTIIADASDVQSVVSLGNDDLGEDDREGNVIAVKKYTCGTTGK